MKLVCPCCQGEFPLEAALNDVAARMAVLRAFKATSFGDLLTGYVSLFKPAQRAISMTRLAKLLDEVLDMIEDAKVERNGKQYAAPLDYWKQAIDEMLQRRESLTLPLKSHGYLITIVVGYSDKAAAKDEKKQEDAKRFHAVKPGQPKATKQGMPASVREAIEGMGMLKTQQPGGEDGNPT